MNPRAWMILFLAVALCLQGPVAGVTGPARELHSGADQPSGSPASLLPGAGTALQAEVSGPSAGGVRIFPADHIWNTPIDALPVDPRSGDYIRMIGSSAGLHADFGSGLYDGNLIGIPFNVVNGSQPKRAVAFDYTGESDPGPYPIPDQPLIEGGSDHHLLVIDQGSGTLYELFAAAQAADGSWTAGSGAIYNLSAYALRPKGWTSADAAGLPILPGLARYDETVSYGIHHALRFTAPSTRRAYIWPARHFASSLTDPSYPPMGQRFRLKASFNTSAFPPQARAVLEGLKTYGMILSDNGAPWYITGAPDERWDNDDLHTLGQVKGTDFEAVDCSSLMADPDSGQALVHPSTPNASSGPGVYRQSTHTFHLDRGGDRAVDWGTTTDLAVTGDWNGDGTTEVGVFRSSLHTFFLRNGSGATWSTTAINWGTTTDTPVTGDWNGDGITEVGVFRPSLHTFFLRNGSSATWSTTAINWGTTTDTPVTGDWNGDGITEVGVFRPSLHTFFLRNRTGAAWSTTAINWGTATDTPVTGDWDNDRITEVGVFRSAIHTFYLRNDGYRATSPSAISWGVSGDIPVTGRW